MVRPEVLKYLANSPAPHTQAIGLACLSIRNLPAFALIDAVPEYSRR